MSFLLPQDLDEGGMDYPRPKPEPWRLWDALGALLRGRLRGRARPTVSEQTAVAQAEFWRGVELNRQLAKECKQVEAQIAELEPPAPLGCIDPEPADDASLIVGGTITAGDLTIAAFTPPPPCDRAGCGHSLAHHASWVSLEFEGRCHRLGCCCPSYVTLQREDPNQ